jgi:hypothetical protein
MRPRRAHSKWCRYHKERAAKYRSPTGRPPSRESVTYNKRRFLKFAEQHRDHPGIAAAAGALGELLETPQRFTTDYVVTAELARLKSFGLTGQGALSALSGVFLTYNLDRTIPDEALPFLAARKLLGCKPRLVITLGRFGLTVRDRAPALRRPVTTQRTLGAMLVRLVGGFYLRVAEKLRADEAAQQTRVLAFCEPFHPTPTVSPSTQGLQQ